MKPRRVMLPGDIRQVFDQAVAERALAVLTVQDGADWTTFKCRFLERDPQGRYFVLDHDTSANPGLPRLVAGRYVGVTLRHRSRKLLFATVVEAIGHFARDGHPPVPAVRYRWPETVTELQRRAYQRTPVPSGVTLPVTIWLGGVQARQVDAAHDAECVAGDLIDLSCGGAMVRLHCNDVPDWPEDITLGMELGLLDSRPPVLLDARCRGARPNPAAMPSLGVQFVGFELKPDGKAVLQRLANTVQRLNRMIFGAEHEPGKPRSQLH